MLTSHFFLVSFTSSGLCSCIPCHLFFFFPCHLLSLFSVLFGWKTPHNFSPVVSVEVTKLFLFGPSPWPVDWLPGLGI